MNCPLKQSAVGGGGMSPPMATSNKCEEEYCAWWDKPRKHCIMFTIKSAIIAGCSRIDPVLKAAGEEG